MVFISSSYWQSAENTHTHTYIHKGPSYKSLLLHKTPSWRSTAPHPYYFIKKIVLKNISSVVTMVIFTYNCVFHFSVSWFSEMEFGVIYFKTWGSTTLCLILNTCILFWFCFIEHAWHQILLHCMSQCLLCLKSSLFSWLMDRACLLCLAVWGRGTLPASCIRSLTNVSL